MNAGIRLGLFRPSSPVGMAAVSLSRISTATCMAGLSGL